MADEQQELTDEMIVSIVNKENEFSDGDELSDDANFPVKISHTDGLKTIISAIDYIEQQEEATPAILLSLKKW